ncbi:MAG: 23S rRNA (guanosine(2251)-2'-O)-methyltransferase RlmB [Gammaproteobacteria bacterium]|nr:23S rRNA (guanosine(2251)-2'-O)-methyltransferase RlmB [Gammaproteobacteria bacterium]
MSRGRRRAARRPAAQSADSAAGGLSWVHGIHAVGSMLAHHPQRLQRLLASESRHDRRLTALVEQAQAAGVPIERVPAEVLEAQAPGALHQGILAQVEIPAPMDEYALQALVQRCEGPPLLLILDGVQDPRNLGACLRSADAAGVDAVVMPSRRAAPLTATAVKVASGAAASVPIAEVVNLARVLRWLKDQGIRVIGTAGGAERPVWQAELAGGLALVVGGEGAGLRHLTRQLCDELVSLPMAGVAESLNVSVATGVCLYEALRQRSLVTAARGGASGLPPQG